MASSAKRPKAKPAKRRTGHLRNGAVAVGTMISDNPVLVGGSTAFLVTLFYVSANALWYQPYPHKGAFFATRTIEHVTDAPADEPETTINIERPEPAPVPPAPMVRPDPTVQKVQGVLKELGFYSGEVDGIPGPNTQKAIDTYRHKVGLPDGTIDAALLDVNLEGAFSYPIAAALTERDVPFLFLTGYDGWSLPETYRSIPRIAKPFSAASLLTAAEALIGVDAPL